MYRILGCFLVFLIITSTSLAQSLRIIDVSNNVDITNATIMKQSGDNHGWVGFESLDLGIKVINTTTGTLVVGSKKIEHDILQPDVQHTFCFAGSCFPASTFVSPNHQSLSAGMADSQFLAHYLFNNTVHVRGINHVSYVFYDVNNPSDSVVVHVTYNTVMNVGIMEQQPAVAALSIFPNPANGVVTFLYAAAHADAVIEVRDVSGSVVAATVLHKNEKQVIMHTDQFATGMYYYTFVNGSGMLSSGKFVVAH